ncbi:DUF1045 domain-containing protein [Sinorhizobium sp. BG8]|uniref:DUF1045 domain-containing protein n=1 Tax=Sinorhizobium sp. BG8 TaxID=2613773 RepID=UPI00193EB11D|nr:DUF1045 domain-containing protein [Sinorhizobium sp. BG8]QRM56373.1 DUF1045 domain-containing protein [Sinorhizobium sp. BG8]
MRYAIYFTPPVHHPLSVAAAAWLGRNAFSGELVDAPPLRGLTVQELAYYTALPRRYGFHASLKAPFRLAEGMTEAMLLKELMLFAGAMEPFHLAPMEIVRCGDSYGLAPALPDSSMSLLAAKVVQTFDAFRAPLSEAEIERRDPDSLTAPQFANLHRWGDPHVMDEYRFQMSLTGTVGPSDGARVVQALREQFAAAACLPLEVSSIALFVEEETGSPFRVHSLHPIGRVDSRRIA